MSRALLIVPVLAVLALLAPGCGDSDSAYEFTDVREGKQDTPLVPPGMTSGDRFGMGGHGGDPHAGMHGGGGGDPHAGMPGKSSAPFTWTTPDGWEEAKGHSMRAGSWRVKGQPKTDCSLSLLQGLGGDMLDNVNRWRNQMKAKPVSASEVAALPRKKMLGKDAIFVNITGANAGMGGEKAAEDARLLGLLLTLPGRAVFLKFTGPAEVVAANEGAFLLLAASIKPAAQAPSAGMGAPSAGRPAFKWSLPDGWEIRKGRPGRIVTVGPKDASTTECYLYPLSGDGGGVVLNLNRWRSQMGQKSLDEEAIAKLERIDVLGVKATLIQIKGPFRGQSGESLDGALLYGMVCLTDRYLLTAKMTGPTSVMDKEWDNFVSFCKSIRD